MFTWQKVFFVLKCQNEDHPSLNEKPFSSEIARRRPTVGASVPLVPPPWARRNHNNRQCRLCMCWCPEEDETLHLGIFLLNIWRSKLGKLLLQPLTACLLRKTSCRPPASSNSNISTGLSDTFNSQNLIFFGFLLIFPLIVHQTSTDRCSQVSLCNSTSNKFISLNFFDNFHKFFWAHIENFDKMVFIHWSFSREWVKFV